ncbi:MAG TPA: hypothetical protein DCQ93_07495 [Bacteroidetes bacterium]|nr:hypothetical protein [Bacteroidota bacterium]
MESNVENKIINKVAESDLITLDLEDFFPKVEIVPFDLKKYLFHELVLKEKDFREALRAHDWEQYKGKTVAIHCSADAIIPMWAFMLVGVHLNGIATYHSGNEKEVLEKLFLDSLKKISIQDYLGKRVLVKGCGDKEVPQSVFVEASSILLPVVKSLMYGEACSNVPLMKRK